MEIADLECPNCGASQIETTDDGRLVCVYCDSILGPAAQVCPECGHRNGEGVRYCADCGAQILRECPACGVDNWLLADHCRQCGRNLDLIEHLAERWKTTTQQRLYEQQAGMAALKDREEQASVRRMAGMMEEERLRLEAIAQAEAGQRRKDRQMLALMAGVLIFFAILAMVAIVLSATGS